MCKIFFANILKCLILKGFIFNKAPCVGNFPASPDFTCAQAAPLCYALGTVMPGCDMKQNKPLLWSTYSEEHAGWCVWLQQPGSLAAEIVAGPFQTRKEADDLLGPLLGPLLGQVEAPNEQN